MREDKILRVALDWSVDEIDPPRSFGGWNTARVVQQTHESLFEDDFDSAPVNFTDPTDVVPRLAVDCEISDDFRRYVFTVRSGVTFHDGAPLNAEAIVINYERLYCPDSLYFSPVAADFNRAGVELIDKVRALDNMTVEFTLSEASPEFLRYMTQEDAPGSQSLISPEAIRNYGPDECSDRAPGTGPFRFHRRFETEYGSAVELRRNDSYWYGCSQIEAVQFLPFPDRDDRVKALVDGRVDFAYSLEGADLVDLSARGFNVPEFSPPYLWYLVLNQREPQISDIRVRHAIAHAIDRKALCAELFPGAAIPAVSAIPPGAPSYDAFAPDYYPYDPGLAKKLLKDAGFPNGLVLKVEAARAGSAQLNPGGIFERLAQDLKKVGIQLEVNFHEDWVTYCNQWREGAPVDVAFTEMSWGMSSDLWLAQVLHGANQSPGGFNAGYNADAEVDALLDRARRTLAKPDRTSLYREADSLLMKRLPILPLFTSRRGMFAYSQRVRGLTTVNQCWHDFRNVSLK
ncbi:ABC transporter substrate-binding protein [Vreelandella glaciei]|uniref:ABC transporter substrate-binding protein n=1 Tax=Vreelandella glaciei TaxID=186761 RepID=UPI0030ED7C79|tara:strand:+ start:12943 stop:14487 length:1545 start_codon:yes stop_codon:yes gene_type:complete